MRPLLISLLLAGCAHAPARTATTTPAAPNPAPKNVLHDADAAVAAGKYADALALLAPYDGHGDADVAYLAATARLHQRDFDGAARELQALVDDAHARRQPDRGVWPYNALTWVRWAQHDHAGALSENDRFAKAAEPLPSDDRRGALLHYWWDRAYLLEEDPATRDEAAKARHEYESLARMPDQADGVAVLAAFFAVQEGDGARAISEAKKVDASKDDDLQDLYVLQLAYDLGGDAATATALRRTIAKGNEYPMKPVILQRLDFDRAQR
jgi:hypothetical protein